MNIRRTCLALATVSVSIITSGFAELRATSHAIAGVIVFSGRPLAKPVVLSDLAENGRLLAAASQHVALADSTLARRPKLEVAIYWGAEWRRFASTPDSLAMLPHLREAQSGVYYPAFGREPAVWVFGPIAAMGSSTRAIRDEGIAILRAHHLPVVIK